MSSGGGVWFTVPGWLGGGSAKNENILRPVKPTDAVQIDSGQRGTADSNDRRSAAECLETYKQLYNLEEISRSRSKVAMEHRRQFTSSVLAVRWSEEAASTGSNGETETRLAITDASFVSESTVALTTFTMAENTTASSSPYRNSVASSASSSPSSVSRDSSTATGSSASECDASVSSVMSSDYESDEDILETDEEEGTTVDEPTENDGDDEHILETDEEEGTTLDEPMEIDDDDGSMHSIPSTAGVFMHEPIHCENHPDQRSKQSEVAVVPGDDASLIATWDQRVCCFGSSAQIAQPKKVQRPQHSSPARSATTATNTSMESLDFDDRSNSRLKGALTQTAHELDSLPKQTAVVSEAPLQPPAKSELSSRRPRFTGGVCHVLCFVDGSIEDSTVLGTPPHVHQQSNVALHSSQSLEPAKPALPLPPQPQVAPPGAPDVELGGGVSTQIGAAFPPAVSAAEERSRNRVQHRRSLLPKAKTDDAIDASIRSRSTDRGSRSQSLPRELPSRSLLWQTLITPTIPADDEEALEVTLRNARRQHQFQRKDVTKISVSSYESREIQRYKRQPLDSSAKHRRSQSSSPRGERPVSVPFTGRRRPRLPPPMRKDTLRAVSKCGTIKADVSVHTTPTNPATLKLVLERTGEIIETPILSSGGDGDDMVACGSLLPTTPPRSESLLCTPPPLRRLGGDLKALGKSPAILSPPPTTRIRAPHSMWLSEIQRESPSPSNARRGHASSRPTTPSPPPPPPTPPRKPRQRRPPKEAEAKQERIVEHLPATAPRSEVDTTHDVEFSYSEGRSEPTDLEMEATIASDIFDVSTTAPTSLDPTARSEANRAVVCSGPNRHTPENIPDADPPTLATVNMNDCAVAVSKETAAPQIVTPVSMTSPEDDTINNVASSCSAGRCEQPDLQLDGLNETEDFEAAEVILPCVGLHLADGSSAPTPDMTTGTEANSVIFQPNAYDIVDSIFDPEASASANADPDNKNNSPETVCEPEPRGLQKLVLASLRFQIDEAEAEAFLEKLLEDMVPENDPSSAPRPHDATRADGIQKQDEESVVEAGFCEVNDHRMTASRADPFPYTARAFDSPWNHRGLNVEAGFVDISLPEVVSADQPSTGEDSFTLPDKSNAVPLVETVLFPTVNALLGRTVGSPSKTPLTESAGDVYKDVSLPVPVLSEISETGDRHREEVNGDKVFQGGGDQTVSIGSLHSPLSMSCYESALPGMQIVGNESEPDTILNSTKPLTEGRPESQIGQSLVPTFSSLQGLKESREDLAAMFSAMEVVESSGPSRAEANVVADLITTLGEQHHDTMDARLKLAPMPIDAGGIDVSSRTKGSGIDDPSGPARIEASADAMGGRISSIAPVNAQSLAIYPNGIEVPDDANCLGIREERIPGEEPSAAATDSKPLSKREKNGSTRKHRQKTEDSVLSEKSDKETLRSERSFAKGQTSSAGSSFVFEATPGPEALIARCSEEYQLVQVLPCHVEMSSYCGPHIWDLPYNSTALCLDTSTLSDLNTSVTMTPNDRVAMKLERVEAPLVTSKVSASTDSMNVIDTFFNDQNVPCTDQSNAKADEIREAPSVCSHTSPPVREPFDSPALLAHNGQVSDRVVYKSPGVLLPVTRKEETRSDRAAFTRSPRDKSRDNQIESDLQSQSILLTESAEIEAGKNLSKVATIFSHAQARQQLTEASTKMTLPTRSPVSESSGLPHFGEHPQRRRPCLEDHATKRHSIVYQKRAHDKPSVPLSSGPSWIENEAKPSLTQTGSHNKAQPQSSMPSLDTRFSKCLPPKPISASGPVVYVMEEVSSAAMSTASALFGVKSAWSKLKASPSSKIPLSPSRPVGFMDVACSNDLSAVDLASLLSGMSAAAGHDTESAMGHDALTDSLQTCAESRWCDVLPPDSPETPDRNDESDTESGEKPNIEPDSWVPGRKPRVQNSAIHVVGSHFDRSGLRPSSDHGSRVMPNHSTPEQTTEASDMFVSTPQRTTFSAERLCKPSPYQPNLENVSTIDTDKGIVREQPVKADTATPRASSIPRLARCSLPKPRRRKTQPVASSGSTCSSAHLK
jgi:hypothetical protein